jgi:hypothetical protein
MIMTVSKASVATRQREAGSSAFGPRQITGADAASAKFVTGGAILP